MALGKQKDSSGHLFLYGLDRFNPAKDDVSSSTYNCSVKLFDAYNDLLGRHQFKFDYLDQSFTESKLLPGMGLDGITNPLRMLNNANFHIIDIPIQYIFVDVLNDLYCRNLCQNSGPKTIKRFGVMASNHKLLAHLREECLDLLP